MSDEGLVRKKRRHRRSEPAVTVDHSDHGNNHNHRRGGRVSRRLLLSIWLLVGLNFCLLIVGVMYLISIDDNEAIERMNAYNMRQTLYQRAIEDAAYAGVDRTSHFLQPIDFTNGLLKWREEDEQRWVRVLLWTNEQDYQQTYRPLLESGEEGLTPDQDPSYFVTLVPQVKQFCKRLTNNQQFDVSFRLKQYLGLNPQHRYERFVELWVRPGELFRPCPDPEIDDRFCNTEISQRGVRVKNVEDYPALLRRMALQAYQPEGRPWTRMGYTYDWANGQPGVGASEYMLIPKARFTVFNSYSTDEYCGLDDQR